MELERIYGVRQGSTNQKGNNRIGDRHNVADQKTQQDLAGEMGLDQKQLQRYKQLNDLIPELQQMIENGCMKATVGYKIWAKMSQEEQEKFFEEIGREKLKTMTQKATEEYINKINDKEKEDEGYIKRIYVDGWNKIFVNKIHELFGQKVEVIEIKYNNRCLDKIEFAKNDCILLDDVTNRYNIKADDFIRKALFSGAFIYILTEDICKIKVLGHEVDNRKPPLGITPRFILDETRRDEILAGIDRYIEFGKEIPSKWVDELNEIIMRLSEREV